MRTTCLKDRDFGVTSIGSICGREVSRKITQSTCKTNILHLKPTQTTEAITYVAKMLYASTKANMLHIPDQPTQPAQARDEQNTSYRVVHTCIAIILYKQRTLVREREPFTHTHSLMAKISHLLILRRSNTYV
jgi:hypothetical protein